MEKIETIYMKSQILFPGKEKKKKKMASVLRLLN